VRVVVNEDMKVFHGHVPVALKAGQEISGDLAELLLAGTRGKVTRVDPDEEPAEVPRSEEVDKLNIDGKIDEVLAWVGDDLDRAAEARAAEEAKGDRARPRLLSKLAEFEA